MLFPRLRLIFSTRLLAAALYVSLSAALFILGYSLIGPRFSPHPSASIPSSAYIPDSASSSASSSEDPNAASDNSTGMSTPNQSPAPLASVKPKAASATNPVSGSSKLSSDVPDATQTVKYSVNAGSFTSIASASAISKTLRSAGYSPRLQTLQLSDRTLYELRVGIYRSKDNAEKVADSVRSIGVEAYLVVVP